MEARRKKQVEKEDKQKKQESIQTLASWQLLGADTSQLFLLDQNTLEKQAKELGVGSTDQTKDMSKEKLISSISKVRRGGDISNNSRSSSSMVIQKRRAHEPSLKDITTDSIPSNYNLISLTV